MTLFILTETSAGYALLKAKDKKLLKRDDIAQEASTAEGISNLYVTCSLCHPTRQNFDCGCTNPVEGRKNFVISENVTNLVYSLKLKAFQKFDSAASALEEATSIVEGKVTPRLASLLDGVKDEKKVSLAVMDTKLGKNIRNQKFCG